MGLQQSSYGRTGFTALFDHLLGTLKEKLPTVKVIYGSRVSHVTPFYSASFPKDYHNLPAVVMSTQNNVEEEVGIGQMANGPSWGDALGIHNITEVQIDVWARNRLEQEAIANAVKQVIQRNKVNLYQKGIRDIRIFRVSDRVFDPNAPRAWWGATQAPGEIWLKIIDYVVHWDYVWSPNLEDGTTGIEKIDVSMDMDGTVLTTTVGLLTLGLLDSMYLYRQLGRGIKILRTGGRY
jgi:hypothetical protein